MPGSGKPHGHAERNHRATNTQSGRGALLLRLAMGPVPNPLEIPAREALA